MQVCTYSGYLHVTILFLQKAAQVSSDIFVKYFKKQIMEIVDDEKVGLIIKALVTGEENTLLCGP